jgi:hypothetical protein
VCLRAQLDLQTTCRGLDKFYGFLRRFFFRTGNPWILPADKGNFV